MSLVGQLRLLVVIDSKDYRESGFLEAEAEPTRSPEQVYSQWFGGGLEPVAQLIQFA